MANLDGYTVNISVESSHAKFERKNGAFYFRLPHNSKYSIVLGNNHQHPSQAVIKIDGVRVGKFFLDPWGTTTVSSPVDDNRGFVFVAENSSLASSAGVLSGREQNGLIVVEFLPLRRIEQSYPVRSYPMGYGQQSYPTGYGQQSYQSAARSSSFAPSSPKSRAVTAGATVLGEESNSLYEAITGYESYGKEVVIMIRLEAIVSNYPVYPHSVTPYPNRLPSLPSSPSCGRCAR